MKKNIFFILIFIFLFTFSCTFNLFEGDVEANYKALKDPAEKIEYARQILAGGDKEKIATIIDLLKADITAGVFNGESTLLTAANQIVGNLLIAQSGFNNLVSNVISQIISSSSSGSDPDSNIITSIVDSNGDGNLTPDDLDAIKDILEDLAEAADYINNAAQSQPENLDLQLQNIIANLAAAVTTVFNSSEADENTLQQLADYFNGTSQNPPQGYDNITTNVNNISSSVNNILNNAPQDSIYYNIAQTLQQIFANIIS